ncbi:MAG: DUF6386 family protein [Pseudomonadota bacterium]
MFDPDLPAAARALADSIVAETDPRTRMQLCKRSIGLGRQAVKDAESLSDRQIVAIQETLRLAHRVSLGTYNPNTSITKLAKVRMERLGLTSLPILGETRPKRVLTDTACLAISDRELEGDWFDTLTALSAINAGRYGLLGVGADGAYSVCLRLIDAEEHFHEPVEYKRIVEVSPVFALRVGTGRLVFGAAENLMQGGALEVENGRYLVVISSLRSGPRLRFIATALRSEAPVADFHQLPDLREL